MALTLQSSNPVLADDAMNPYGYRDEMAASRPTTATLQGVVNKTAILVGIAVLAGAAAYKFAPANPSIMTISCIAAFGIAIGSFFVLRGNPERAIFIGPIYAIAEGAFLGALTAVLDMALTKSGVVAVGGLALQAFVITIALMLTMLILYSLRILRPTRTFVAVVSIATAGIMVTYLLSFIVGMVFGKALPFVSVMSVFEGGPSAWIGVGINVVFLIVAALGLVMDFKMIEDRVNAGVPKRVEWYCGFALLVTLAWIYFEAVKLAFRLAVLLSARE